MSSSLEPCDQEDSYDGAISEFEKQIRDDVNRDNSGSITSAVVMSNKLVWSKSFGYANIAAKSAANVESIYRTGSITKSFTAVILVQLTERSVLNLDDPVEVHFPEVSKLYGYRDYPPITFRQLASHTSGLIREPELENAASGPIGFWEDKVLESIPETRIQSEPGTEFSYSNIGFGILGLALSRASNHPYMDLVNENILKPLKMENSVFVWTENMRVDLADGYVIEENGSVNPEFPEMEHVGRGYKVPNGGLYSTAGDLGKFIAALTGSTPTRILSPEKRMEMQRRQTPGTEGPGYGLGLRVESDSGLEIIGHGGSVAGYNAAMSFNPATETGVILLRNYSKGSTNLKQIAKELLLRIASKF